MKVVSEVGSMALTDLHRHLHTVHILRFEATELQQVFFSVAQCLLCRVAVRSGAVDGANLTLWALSIPGKHHSRAGSNI